MKPRIAHAIYLAVIFSMCVIVVRLVLYVFGYGLGGVAIGCLALAGLLLVFLVDTNPEE